MLDFPPDTPWIYAWLGAAGLLGLIIGWLLGRIGKGRLKRERTEARAELDEALESRRSAEEAMVESGGLVTDLQQRLDETTTSLSDADREIDRLRSEIETAENRVAEMESDTSRGHADSAEADRLAARLDAANEEIDALRAALSAATVDTDARVSAAESEAQEAVSRAAVIEEALSAAKLERENLLARLEEGGPREGGDQSGEIAALHEDVAAARADAVEATARLVEIQQELDDARRKAPDGDAGELAARDALIRELQERVDDLAGIEDRLTAREAEFVEISRDHSAVVAVKDGELASLRDRLAALKTQQAQLAEAAAAAPEDHSGAETANADLQAEIESLRSELAATAERADHWEREAAGLRSEIAAPDPTPAPIAEAPALAAEPPAPIAEPVSTAPVPAGIEERLDRLQETLSDKEARIAYLADRVARLESNLGTVKAVAPAPVAAEPDPEPEPEPIAPVVPDDLTEIWGIGPAIQRHLNSVGIATFEQVAALRPEDQHRLGDVLGDFLDRFEADDWVGQARALVEARGGVVPDEPLAPIRLVPPAAPAQPDDLTEIKGIGPFIQKTLGDLGVTTFAQIASWTPEEVEHYGDALVIFQDRISREEWVEQARRLMRKR